MTQQEKRLRVRELLKTGMSTKEIMSAMNLSRTAIGHHVTCLMREFGLYGRADHRRLIVCLLMEKK